MDTRKGHISSLSLLSIASFQGSSLRRRPPPVSDFGPVDAFGVGVADAVDDLSLEPFLQVRCGRLQSGNAIDDIDGEVEAIDLIANGKLEGRVDIALFLIS